MAKNKIDFGIKQKPKRQNGTIKKLLSFFRIVPTKGYISPAEVKKDSNGKDKTLTPIDMPSSLQQAYEYLVQNLNVGVYLSNQYRFERYKTCKYMVTESPIINTATQIYVSEAFSPKEGQESIIINAKDKKVESLFYEWLNNVGFNDNIIREFIYNLVVYGDAFWINEINLENSADGITSITPLSPFLVKDRIEFNVNVVMEQKSWSQTCLNLTNKYSSLKQIYDLVTDIKSTEDFSQFYKTYLLGYALGIGAEEENTNEQIFGVPPWAITHCRMFTTENDFAPFGKPLFINAISNYQSYKTTQMLIDMLRVASFPREVIKIKGAENMDVYSRIDRVDSVRMFLENITPKTENQDGLAVGERIYTMEDLFEFDLIDPDIDMDKLGDLEMKEKSLVMGTGIPDSYLLPSEGAGDLGGENAQSLYYLNKIFQRRCNGIRSALLEGIEESFRIHLLLTGKFDGDKTEFELAIPTNTDNYDDEKITRDSDFLDLATNILNNLGEMVGLERGDKLPDSIIKDVLKMYMPIEPSVLDKWVNILVKEADKIEKEKEEMMGDMNNEKVQDSPLIMTTGNSKSNQEKKKLKEIIDKIEKENLIKECYLEYKKKNGLSNGVFGKIYCKNNTSLYKQEKRMSTFLLKNEINGRRLQETMNRIQIKD